AVFFPAFAEVACAKSRSTCELFDRTAGIVPSRVFANRKGDAKGSAILEIGRDAGSLTEFTPCRRGPNKSPQSNACQPVLRRRRRIPNPSNPETRSASEAGSGTS